MNNDVFKYILNRAKFEERDIYNFFINIDNEDEVNNSIYTPEDKEAFINNILEEVEKRNNGINSDFILEANYYLFMHLLILRSEYVIPEIYNKYDVAVNLNSLGYVTNSVSDSATSISSTATGAITDQGLQEMEYMIDKFGQEYLLLLKRIKPIMVVL